MGSALRWYRRVPCRMNSSVIANDVEEQEGTNHVRSVERTLLLIELFTQSRQPFSISDLAAASQLPASTVHRLVRSLMQLGYVTQHAKSKRYGLGRGIAELGRAMLLKYEFSQHAEPYLVRLAQDTGESATLAALYGTGIMYLSQIESSSLMRVAVPVGTTAPLHCTAPGKVFLADFQPGLFNRAIQFGGLEHHTAHTITSKARLEEHLQEVRQRGYAVDDEEFTEGARCVSAPLRGSSGAVSAAISVAGPATRLTKDRIPEIAEIVRDIADEFAHALREP